jgi:transcription elongation factor S-II
MATEEMKKIRQEFTKEGIRESQMAKNTGTVTALFKCMKCGLRKTTYTQVKLTLYM